MLAIALGVGAAVPWVMRCLSYPAIPIMRNMLQNGPKWAILEEAQRSICSAATLYQLIPIFQPIQRKCGIGSGVYCMLECPYCRQALPLSARFCAHCGERLPAMTSAATANGHADMEKPATDLPAPARPSLDDISAQETLMQAQGGL